MSSMVSVIIPTYNRPEMLKTAVESALNQECGEMEIIVGRNGGEKVTVPDDKRIRFVEWEKNDFRHHNELIDMAKGEYIAILHDDDIFWNCNSLLHREEILEEVEVVYTDYLVQFKFCNEIHKPGPVSIERILKDDYIGFGAMMWRRSIKEKIGGYWLDTSLRYNMDWDFKIRCLLKCSCKYFPMMTHIYNKHDNQESERARYLDFPERIIIKNRYKEALNV